MEFNIVDKLLGMTLLGAEWVLWLLLFLSVVSIAIIVERAIFFSFMKLNFDQFQKTLVAHLGKNEFDTALSLCKEGQTVECLVAKEGLEKRSQGERAMQGSMDGLMSAQRQKFDRGLVVLGTLGNNAPFIGLFGTVIGIIQSFNDLALNPDGGPSVVMAGISEALVATAVGLLVAIPAVIAFNTFNRIVKTKMANANAIAQIVMLYS